MKSVLEAPKAAVSRPRRRSGALRNYAILIAVVLLAVLLSFLSPAFFTVVNFLDILEQNAPLAIIASAGTLVIIGGGFDLSTGSVYALSGVVAAAAALKFGVWPGMIAGLLVGLALGLLNGLLVTAGRVNTFIATLATSIMILGLAEVTTGGFLITVPGHAFAALGNGAVLGVKFSIWIFIVFFLMCAFLLHRTTFGRYVYAVGGNAEAARFSGVRVDLIRVATFALSGFAAGLAGIIAASRVGQGDATVGQSLTLSAIASIVIGGTSILGGEGAVWRSILGILLIALIGNGFNLININSIYQQIVEGAIIVIAVGLDAWSRTRRA